MTKPYALTDAEANMIKDILKAAARSNALGRDLAKSASMTRHQFDEMADKVFEKLGNGRVIVENG